MVTNRELIKKVLEEKRQKSKQQEKLKNPHKLIGQPHHRIKNHKGGGLFDK